MVGQLDRSRARRRLTSLCSNLILEILEKDTDQNTLKVELENKYKSACIIALGVSVEALTGKEIQKSATTNGRILSLFKAGISAIQNLREKQNSSDAARELIKLIKSSRKSIVEEDLGGISELFSGHTVSWKGDEIQ